MGNITEQIASIGQLKSQAHEFVKQHIEYDAQSRPEYIYTAPAHVRNNGGATVTRYGYDGITSRVVFMKESTAVWNSTWDLF